MNREPGGPNERWYYRLPWWANALLVVALATVGAAAAMLIGELLGTR